MKATTTSIAFAMASAVSLFAVRTATRGDFASPHNARVSRGTGTLASFLGQFEVGVHFEKRKQESNRFGNLFGRPDGGELAYLGCQYSRQLHVGKREAALCCLPFFTLSLIGPSAVFSGLLLKGGKIACGF